MLAILARRKARRLIQSALSMEKNQLELDIVRLAMEAPPGVEKIPETILRFQNRVANRVSAALAQSDPIVHGRFLTLICSPQACGLSERLAEGSLSAGALYAVCYSSFCQKRAPAADCIEMSRLQHELISRVAGEIIAEAGAGEDR